MAFHLRRWRREDASLAALRGTRATEGPDHAAKAMPDVALVEGLVGGSSSTPDIRHPWRSPLISAETPPPARRPAHCIATRGYDSRVLPHSVRLFSPW